MSNQFIKSFINSLYIMIKQDYVERDQTHNCMKQPIPFFEFTSPKE
jgi:hypothetical protein